VSETLVIGFSLLFFVFPHNKINSTNSLILARKVAISSCRGQPQKLYIPRLWQSC
jgi:hypothetical protein